METSAISKPIGIGELLWRKSPSDYPQTGIQSTGRILNSDNVSISNEASVLSELHRATVSGYSGKTADLLTDAERTKFENMSSHYGGERDTEIGNLAISLAMDKIMATASGTNIPTLDKEYLLSIVNDLSGGTQGDTLHSKLDVSFLSDLLNNSHLLA